jgi:hypothetical protein
MINENDIEYFTDLPEGYVIMEDYKELFTLKEGEITITVDNAIIREGLELILYNPQTDVFYPRYLSRSSDRKNYYKYFKYGNLFIKQKDLIWKKNKS